MDDWQLAPSNNIILIIVIILVIIGVIILLFVVFSSGNNTPPNNNNSFSNENEQDDEDDNIFDAGSKKESPKPIQKPTPIKPAIKSIPIPSPVTENKEPPKVIEIIPTIVNGEVSPSNISSDKSGKISDNPKISSEVNSQPEKTGDNLKICSEVNSEPERISDDPKISSENNSAPEELTNADELARDERLASVEEVVISSESQKKEASPPETSSVILLGSSVSKDSVPDVDETSGLSMDQSISNPASLSSDFSSQTEQSIRPSRKRVNKTNQVSSTYNNLMSIAKNQGKNLSHF